MATVAATLVLFDGLNNTKHRPTLYTGRWTATQAALATLNDGSGSKIATVAALGVLKRRERAPTQYANAWNAVRALMAVLADA